MIFKNQIKQLSNEAGFSDLLNYAHIVRDGVLINKDGAFLMGYQFRGPDIHSAEDAELDALASNFNRMMTFLDDGWMVHVDEIRIPSITYPDTGYFPDIGAAMIDDERRSLYESEGAHYENLQFITFIWKFPLPIIKTTRHWFVEGIEKNTDCQNLNDLLELFINTVSRCVSFIGTQLILDQLNTQDLLSFLNSCISGETLPIALPPPETYIDVLFGRHNVVGGYIPRIGKKSVIALSIVGYLNAETVPGLLEAMCTYPVVYRWSNRFIPLSEGTAEREIKLYQKNWNNKVKGFVGILREVILGRPTDKINVDALEMSNETTEALTANSSYSTRFGYWTSTIVLMDENIDLIEDIARELKKYLEQSGFSCIQEDVNAFDAYLGSIPGHGSSNIRRIFLNSVNLAHVLPLHTIWAGELFSSSSSLLPKSSPPVFYAATTGKTPFRFNLDVGDVGHQMVLGPTGAGKSTYLGFLISQFLRYKDAQIFVFDKDYSHKALTIALGGYHYDIGNADELSFCPLADLSTESKKVRAEQFIEDLVYLQNVSITPSIRMAIHSAIDLIAKSKDSTSRNITIVRSAIQNEEVRAALQYYTIDGQIKLLDATEDALKTGYLQTFEMGWLLSQKPEIYLPVLMYIFDQIESRLEEGEGRKPTLIILEEAWLYIGHEVFARKLRDWLKTLRKKNARAVFATQSLSDLYDPTTKTLTHVTAAMMESCPTKVYLPNPKIEAETRGLYQKMGLTDRQIEIISHEGIPKKHYYVVTPEGNRLIDLGFDSTSLALSLIGLSKERSNKLISCHKKYKENWLWHWLEENDLSDWANYLNDKYLNSKNNKNSKSIVKEERAVL
jgi:type IV secretion system protein VirB4